MAKNKTKFSLTKEERKSRIIRRGLLGCTLISLLILVMEMVDNRFTVDYRQEFDVGFVILWLIMEVEALVRIARTSGKESLYYYFKFDKAEIVFVILSPLIILLSFFFPQAATWRWIIVMKMPNVLRRYNDENDFQIINVAENLYDKFSLKRVFYSAFVRVNEDKDLPALPGGPPLLREHRLYQADWLLRFYGFKAEELLSEDRPFFNVMLDPKEDWAVRHLEQFPVEINRAGNHSGYFKKWW